MNKEEFLDKIVKAEELIEQFYKDNPDAFVAYSGGKDSKVILHLTECAIEGDYPYDRNLVVLHNLHPEETCDIDGTLQVTKEDFPAFIKMAKNLNAQIDGTRTCEFNKKVIFNGELIDRTTIPSKVNDKGVFDLKVLYPILDWTDEEVWAYIRAYQLMTEEEISVYQPSRPYD